MRSVFAFGVGVCLVIVSASACGSGSGTVSDGGTADGSPDGAPEDSATGDATLADGGDGGNACSLMGGTYDKTCGTAADCLMVARGCFCGAQPIIGVARSAAAGAQSCESEGRDKCALGCPNAPGHVAEDGHNDEGTGRKVEVRCDANKCRTVLP